MTYIEALKALPRGAKWSSSFGFPGDACYSEYWRTTDNRNFAIRHVKGQVCEPFDCEVEEIADLSGCGHDYV